MAHCPDDWPQVFKRYWWEGAELLSFDSSDDECPARDSLGLPGRIRERRAVAMIRERRTHAVARRALEEAGLTLRFSEADRAEMAVPAKELRPEQEDPFLLEDRVSATVQGRSFPGQQRAVIEAKCDALRRELTERGIPEKRRDSAAHMLHELEAGLATTVELRMVDRRFIPQIAVPQVREAIGQVLPLTCGTRLVYRVNSVDADRGSEGEAEPMVFHIVALGSREVAVLYTGGVHGFRHIADLEDSAVHHAWFANREKLRSDATAPWIGRRVYRELVEQGTSEVIIHRRRDAEPVAVEKVGDDHSFVRIDGRPWQVPVIRARTSRDDDLVILADPDNPLVLRLSETGAGLVRTIDAIESPPGRAIAPVIAGQPVATELTALAPSAASRVSRRAPP